MRRERSVPVPTLSAHRFHRQGRLFEGLHSRQGILVEAMAGNVASRAKSISERGTLGEKGPAQGEDRGSDAGREGGNAAGSTRCLRSSSSNSSVAAASPPYRYANGRLARGFIAVSVSSVRAKKHARVHASRMTTRYGTGGTSATPRISRQRASPSLPSPTVLEQMGYHEVFFPSNLVPANALLAESSVGSDRMDDESPVARVLFDRFPQTPASSSREDPTRVQRGSAARVVASGKKSGSPTKPITPRQSWTGASGGSWWKKNLAEGERRAGAGGKQAVDSSIMQDESPLPPQPIRPSTPRTLRSQKPSTDFDRGTADPLFDAAGTPLSARDAERPARSYRESSSPSTFVHITPRGGTSAQRRQAAAEHLLESARRARSELRRAFARDAGEGGAADAWEDGEDESAESGLHVEGGFGGGEANEQAGRGVRAGMTPAKWTVRGQGGRTHEISSLADGVRKRLLEGGGGSRLLEQLWLEGRCEDWEDALRLYSVRFAPWGHTLAVLDRYAGVGVFVSVGSYVWCILVGFGLLF